MTNKDSDGVLHDLAVRWFGMSRTTEGKSANKRLACGNSFKTVGKAFQVKLVERMPRVCKAVI